MIAALTEQAKERGVPVMVVTGDRDAYQLVDDGVRIMSTSRGVTDTKVYDRQAVIDRYGIPPELVPDFIGLKGDTSDNIPGVPGIGDKTAADLLQKFGDLEGVLVEHRPDHRRQAQAEPRRARRQRAHVQAARDDGPRRPARHRPRGRVHQDAGPHEAAPGLPRLGAARPAAPARGGARRGRDGGDPAPRRPREGRGQDRPGPQPVRHHAPEGRVPLAGGPAARDRRGRAAPARAEVALRGLRGREHRALRRDRHAPPTSSPRSATAR